jgi:hypothetical protein
LAAFAGGRPRKKRNKKELDDPHDVGGVQSLRTLLTLKLDSLAFIQRLIAFFKDRGEMDEDIFSAGALNKSVPLGPVEPLHHSMLLHVPSPSLAIAAIEFVHAFTGRNRGTIRRKRPAQMPQTSRAQKMMRDGSPIRRLSFDCAESPQDGHSRKAF